MLSKNNFNEKIRQMDEKKERFSIRKLTVGAASVLIGLIFIGVGGQTVHADTVPATQTEAVATKAATTAFVATTISDYVKIADLETMVNGVIAQLNDAT